MEILKDGPVELDITLADGELHKSLFANNIYLDQEESNPSIILEMEKENCSEYIIRSLETIHNIVVKKSRINKNILDFYGNYTGREFSLKIIFPGKVVAFKNMEMYLSDQVDYFIVLSNPISF